MHITNVKIKGYRNFKDAEINLSQKSLIIGSNDIGKSNFLHALRILLDKSINEYFLEPNDSDFYAYEETNEILITIKFEKVIEECVLTELGKYVSDDNKLYLQYKGMRDPDTGKKEYQLLAGSSEELLQLIDVNRRYYLKVLSLKYVKSIRDLERYIKKEKRWLIEAAKEDRSEDEKDSDASITSKVVSAISAVNKDTLSLSFIKKSTERLNEELKKLSFHNKSQDVIFSLLSPTNFEYLNQLNLMSCINDINVSIGGDGRNNQIFLALWAHRNKSSHSEVNIYCIEEPEAHLHPHQQRMLSKYLCEILAEQVIITSHSPQVACEFSPDSIVKIYSKGLSSVAASNGCGQLVSDAFFDFGYRLNILPAEAFYSDLVFLVEGSSDELFFRALAKKLDIQLDKLNISILKVDSVGFEPYIKLFNALEINWVVLTDNDIIESKKDSGYYRYAGLLRLIKIYENYSIKDTGTDTLICEIKPSISKFKKPIDAQIQEKINQVKSKLENCNLFLLKDCLEADLLNSEINKTLKEFYDKEDDDKLLVSMQRKKATLMHYFLSQHLDELSKLSSNEICKPLLKCSEIILQKYESRTNSTANSDN